MSYVSDIITNEELDTWKPRDTILLTAGTGTGKSHFVLNSLNHYAKRKKQRVLLLVPRASIKKQFELGLTIDDTHFEIQTYQWIESKFLRGQTTFADYDYIVADEAHYFLDDSTFNVTTDVSFQWIMKHSAIKIMMSATSEVLFGLIQMYVETDKIRHYQMKQNFENIEHLYVYPFDRKNPYQYVLRQLRQLKAKNEKALVFINNKTEAKRLHKLFAKDSYLFHGGKQEDEQNEELQEILSNEKFDKLFLITTSVLDTGVTFIDRSLKHIFLDSNSMNSLIQMYGRKRFIDNEDKVTLYVRDFNNSSLGGMLSRNRQLIKPLEIYRNQGVEKFLNCYPMLKDKNNRDIQGFYVAEVEGSNNLVQMNKLYYFHIKVQLKWVEYLLNNKIKFGKEVVKVFESENKHTYVEHDKKIGEIREHLELIAGDKIYGEEKESIIDLVNIHHDGKQLRGRVSINGFLEEFGLPYEISQGKDNKRNILSPDGKKIKNPNYKLSYWMVNYIG